MTTRVQASRTLRFEQAGPAATEVMAWLRANPPRELAGSGVDSTSDTEGGAFRLDLANGRLLVEPVADDALKLTAECWLEQRASAQVVQLLDAMGSYAADPERATTVASLENDALADTRASATQAASLFAGVPTSMSRHDALRLVVAAIDLTTLAGDDTDGRVRALCAQALQPDPTDPTVGSPAAVCVYPNLVPLAVELTKDSDVAVASVAGAFPSGLSSLEVKLSDIAEAVCAGADEIDVVLNRAAFLGGHHDVVVEELRAMRDQIGPRSMKVILETGELASPAAIRSAADLAIDAGANWIKTSTGKCSVGATPEAVFVMAHAIADADDASGPVGLKISGGVRTPADALGYLAIIETVLGPEWLTPERVRFGASGLLTTVVVALQDN